VARPWPIACYDVKLEGGKIRIAGKRDNKPEPIAEPRSVLIVGAGAAGVACAEALRAEGHRGSITLVNGEGSDPVDRPNLSKDYLAGSAPEEWVFLRTQDALASIDITVVADRVKSLDAKTKSVTLESGKQLSADAVLLATGAEPVRLPIPGTDLPHVHTLRTLAESRKIASVANDQTRAVVIGASFIGLEVAASLRARGAAVTVVGPELVPLARVLGDDVGAFIQRVHEGKGVTFKLGRKPQSIAADHVVLDDNTQLPANLVVMGVGVRPRTQIAEAAGLHVDRGVIVDAELRAAPGIWVAGDIARFPYDDELVRIEHWQVAVRQGQAAARSMLGGGASRDIPFFWSQHHDVTLGYVGHAERFDRPTIAGNLDARDAHVVYRDGGVVKAVVTIGRDQLALDVEAALERRDNAALDALLQ
jgi:NADPH-dependent 2,4-dienoyl-CoA reductase/sulfur reductase-like enzyme